MEIAIAIHNLSRLESMAHEIISPLIPFAVIIYTLAVKTESAISQDPNRCAILSEL